MKRIFTFLLIVFAYLTASAESVSEQQAFQIAKEFIFEKSFARTRSKARSIEYFSHTITEHGFYVFNVKDSAGFVIVAGDDSMPQVLGYSDRGALDLTSAPSNLKWLLDYYNKIAEHRIARQQNKVYAGKKGVSVQPIAPLLSTEWGQGVPYNNLCPAIDGTKCLTGCVATALAQVLYYYRFPLQGLGNHSYQYNSNKYEFDFENSIFEWGNMRDNYYPQIQYSEEQLNSVSMLMYACAIST